MLSWIMEIDKVLKEREFHESESYFISHGPYIFP